MSQAAQAFIKLSALQHNLKRAKSCCPNSKLLAVIKANAYGHGLLRVANALCEADALAVACLDEAVILRDAGIQKPILLLSGFINLDELRHAVRYQLDCVVHHESQIDLLKRSAHDSYCASAPLRIWLKVDTGMNRLGFNANIKHVQHLWRFLMDSPVVKQAVLMTHLANADERSSTITQNQFALFEQVSKDLQAPRSLLNSAGILAWPNYCSDWARPGIMLYGASPFNDSLAADHDLQAVMTLRTRLIAVKTLSKGESVGYGGIWRSTRQTMVGIAAIGYGDGYPRNAANGTPVLVNGARAELVGRVSMDMICIDLGPMSSAKVGDRVVLWGEGLPAEEVARSAQTIAYELFCHITSRVQILEEGV